MSAAQARKLAAAEKKMAARWQYQLEGEKFQILGPENPDRSRPVVLVMDASLGHELADFITDSIDKAWRKWK